MGASYRDVIKKLSDPFVYRDLTRPWVVRFFSLFENQVAYRKEGRGNRRLVCTEGGGSTLISFSIVDPEKICEKYLSPPELAYFYKEDFLRLKEGRIVVCSQRARQILQCIDLDYHMLSLQQRQQQPALKKVFNLKHGWQAALFNDHVELLTGSSTFCAKSINMSGSTLNGVYLSSLYLDPTMTEGQFTDALKRAGLID